MGNDGSFGLMGRANKALHVNSSGLFRCRCAHRFATKPRKNTRACHMTLLLADITLTRERQWGASCPICSQLKQKKNVRAIKMQNDPAGGGHGVCGVDVNKLKSQLAVI